MTNIFRLNGRNGVLDNELAAETLPILTPKNFLAFKKFRNQSKELDVVSDIPVNDKYSSIIESENAIPYTYKF